MDFDAMDLYEIVDDILVFGGLALAFFGQLWGLALVVLGIGIMALKGEISLEGEKKTGELSKDEQKYFEYTGEAYNETEHDTEGEGDQDGEGDEGEE